MRWLIIEDALRDRTGHWFEYLATFARELPILGDDVTVWADHSAEPFLVEQLKVQPVLPSSIWHRMGDGAGPIRRYARVPGHAWKTYRTLKEQLRRQKNIDLVFVPTVLVHHLLGWVWLIKGPLKATKARILLFFPNTPVQLDLNSNQPSWQPAPTAKLFNRLIRSLGLEVEQGRVILGAETHPMRDALTQLTGVPFTYFPHPVSFLPNHSDDAGDTQNSSAITMASYGGVRHEKGSDLLVAAVGEYCRRFPDSPVRFILQSVGGEPALWSPLDGNPKVQLVPNYFKNGEYSRALAKTDALLLPYRRSSYGLRVSRVVIEAMMQGIPVVTTKDTTLESQAYEFGAAVTFEDGNRDDFVNAIRQMELEHAKLKAQAERSKPSVQAHFSVNEFRRRILAG